MNLYEYLFRTASRPPSPTAAASNSEQSASILVSTGTHAGPRSYQDLPLSPPFSLSPSRTHTLSITLPLSLSFSLSLALARSLSRSLACSLSGGLMVDLESGPFRMSEARQCAPKSNNFISQNVSIDQF